MEISDTRVLVVEDDTEAMTLLRQMLNSMGIDQVIAAKDGKEAQDLLGACDEICDLVDLIICDWKMPKMTGLDLLRQVRTVSADIPFLMVTGASDEANVLDARSSGVTAYIVKPFSHEQLEKKLSAIHRMMSVRSLAS